VARAVVLVKPTVWLDGIPFDMPYHYCSTRQLRLQETEVYYILSNVGKQSHKIASSLHMKQFHHGVVIFFHGNNHNGVSWFNETHVFRILHGLCGIS
jgi:hypothetical protein